MKNRCLQKLSPLEKLIRILKNNLSIQHIKILRLTKNNFGFHGLLPSDLNITHLPIFVKRYYKYEKIIVPIPNIINAKPTKSINLSPLSLALTLYLFNIVIKIALIPIAIKDKPTP